MRIKEKRTTLNPARDFIPNGKQQEFIEMVGSGEKFVSLFCAANGVGKSSVGANIFTNIIFGPQNEWFKPDAFEWVDRKGVKHIRKETPMSTFSDWPYDKRARIISDPNTIKSKIIPELRKWFPVNESTKMPEANFEESKEGKPYICRITTNTGWDIDVMSTEQDAKEYESADINLVWIDEPMPKDKFMATLARGRLGMIVIWTFTPLKYSAWIKDWMDEHSDGHYADYVEAKMEDNCEIHGTRGILKHENIRRIYEGFPEDESEARAFGKFGHLIGRVHKKFNRKIHVIEPFAIDPRKYTTYFALDPHSNTEDHILYMSVDKNNRKFLSGEVISKGGCKTLYERAKHFEEVMNYRIGGRLIDPSAYNDDQHKDDKSVGAQLFDLGWRDLVKGSKDLMGGIKRTNDAFGYQMHTDGTMIQPPEIYIFNTCPVTIKQLDQYVWAEWKGSSKDDKKASSRPRDKDDHQPENLHRLLLSEPVWTPYEEEVAVGGNYEQETKDLDPYSR